MTRQFYAQKQRRIKYRAFEVSHPDLPAPLRFVTRQHAPKTLGGVAFQPTGATITVPPQDDSPTVSIDVTLGRAGSDVKSQLKLITNWMDEGELTYYEFLDGNDTPIEQVTIPIESVSIQNTDVVIRASTPNTAARNVAQIYTVDRFPGLVES